MSAEQERGMHAPEAEARDDSQKETLTDFIDRMDREAFRRSLQQRDLRVLDSFVVRTRR